MTTTTRLVTADKLMRLPDDGLRRELIAGEIRTMAPVGAQSARITARLCTSLEMHAQAHGLGDVFSGEPGFFLAEHPDTVRAPDIAFIKHERAVELREQTGYIPGPPTLAIEVISPNDLYTEVDDKVAMWLGYGVETVVVVNPRNRTATVHRSPNRVTRLIDTDTLSGEDVVPG
ncbi:MAG: Uma2 family endonuclease [Chloroflexi bacterium]|nr:Uma2 family endonuclease [Chloroflexota bacterium]